MVKISFKMLVSASRCDSPSKSFTALSCLVIRVINKLSDPDLSIHYISFMGLRWRLKGKFSVDLPHCPSQKSDFRPKIYQVPEKAHSCAELRCLMHCAQIPVRTPPAVEKLQKITRRLAITNSSRVSIHVTKIFGHGRTCGGGGTPVIFSHHAKFRCFLPRDAMRKHGLCRRPVSVCLSVRLLYVGALYPEGCRYRETSFSAR